MKPVFIYPRALLLEIKIDLFLYQGIQIWEDSNYSILSFIIFQLKQSYVEMHNNGCH